MDSFESQVSAAYMCTYVPRFCKCMYVVVFLVPMFADCILYVATTYVQNQLNC